MKIIGISAGRKNGNNEILLKHALLTVQEMAGADTHLIRLSDLTIQDCTGCESCMKTLISCGDGLCVQKSDDMQWLLDTLADADGIIVAAPVYDLLPSGNLITMLNRALGAGRDYRNRCKAQKKACAAIAIGGSDWIDFVEPIMNLVLTNLSKDAIVVDRLVAGGYTAPAMVLLDDALMDRAEQLGAAVVRAIQDKEHAGYQGHEGICPGCHCNVIVPGTGAQVTCAFCKARGTARIQDGKLVIDWDPVSVQNHRYTRQGEIDHQADISAAHKKAMDGKNIIGEKRARYIGFDPVLKPHT